VNNIEAFLIKNRNWCYMTYVDTYIYWSNFNKVWSIISVLMGIKSYHCLWLFCWVFFFFQTSFFIDTGGQATPAVVSLAGWLYLQSDHSSQATHDWWLKLRQYQLEDSFKEFCVFLQKTVDGERYWLGQNLLKVLCVLWLHSVSMLSSSPSPFTGLSSAHLSQESLCSDLLLLLSP
jgi:hypothetical protein